MKQTPPTSAPRRPRNRQAQKIASCVEAGPGSRFVAAIPSSNSVGPIQPRSVTHSRRSRAMCVGGPPKPMQPMRPHSRAIVSETDPPGGLGGTIRRGPAQPRRSPIANPRRTAREAGSATQLSWRDTAPRPSRRASPRRRHATCVEWARGPRRQESAGHRPRGAPCRPGPAA